jgi:HEAT repeat protein
MLRALMEATPAVREATAALLGWSGRPEMLRPLVLALGDADASVQAAAAQALLGMDSGDVTLTTLVDLMPTLDPRSRANVCRFVSKQVVAVRARASQPLLDRLTAILETAKGEKNAHTAAAAAQALAALLAAAAHDSASVVKPS